MSEEIANDAADPVATWIRETLDAAVEVSTKLGIVEDALVEARPIWSLPQKVMIGQIREANDRTTFTWVICGDYPTDHIGSAAAATARDAARYFSLKWQLDAARHTDPSFASKLTDWAEELYEIADDDSLWQESGSP